MTERKRKRRKDARPEEIIAAALEVFGEKGYSSTSLSDIAARADISRTTIYLYFEDKEAIIRQAFEDRVGTVFQAGRDHVATADAPFEDIFRQLLTRMYGRLIDKNTLVILKVMISEGNQLPELVKFYHQNILGIAEDMIASLIRLGISKGEVRPEAADFDVKLTIAPIIVAAVWKLTFEDIEPIDLTNFIDGHVELMLRGLSSPTAIKAGN